MPAIVSSHVQNGGVIECSKQHWLDVGQKRRPVLYRVGVDELLLSAVLEGGEENRQQFFLKTHIDFMIID